MKKLFVLFICFCFFGCEFENIEYLVPIMITDAPKSVLTNSAILGGEAIGEGGKEIFEHGIVWSKNIRPTIDDNKIIKGKRLGVFSNLYTVFESNTTYYYCSYGINYVGVSYGSVYEFKTSGEATCKPTLNNNLDLGNSQLKITEIINREPTGFNDGNVEFEAQSLFSTIRIILQFNEIDGRLPLTGVYNTVYNFDNQSVKSNSEIKLSIIDFGLGSPGGASSTPGKTIYVENKNDTITFIFCDVNVSDGDYILKGKFTYNK